MAKFFKDNFSNQELNIWLITALLVTHTLYLFEFYFTGIYQMAYFNIYSVINYVISIFLYKKGYKTLVFLLTFLEIALHQAMATYYVGYGSAFTVVFMCMFLLQFTFFSKNIIRFFVSLFLLACIYLGHFQKDNLQGIYPEWQSFFFCVNIFVTASFMMVYAALATIKPSEKFSDLLNLIYRDFLTGLYNRKYFNDKVLPNLNNEEPALIAICDIDDFKKINDTYGHDVGDLVLKIVSSVILYKISEFKGYVFRWGGEEFLIKLSVDSGEQALEYLNIIREAVALRDIKKHNISPKVTIGGVFIEKPNKKYFEKYFKDADEELYKGKKSGKNIVNIKKF